jgi:hypothetical protein
MVTESVATPLTGGQVSESVPNTVTLSESLSLVLWRDHMARLATTILCLVAVSAHAAYMEGTVTLDDGRVMNLTIRDFKNHDVNGPGGENVTTRVARFRCSGEACFMPIGGFGYALPFAGFYWLTFDDPADGPRHYGCDTMSFDLKRRSCRVQSRVRCDVLDISPGPPFVVEAIAMGMLDVHRTTPRCRPSQRRTGQ